MNKSTGIAAFILGAVIGSGATWYFMKEKYEKLINEEINSVKEVFSKRKPFSIPEEDENDGTNDQPKNDISKSSAKDEVNLYKRGIEKTDYVDYSTNNSNKTATELAHEDEPYVISPEEFGETDDYNQISLVYFSDQVLTDDDYELVEDVDRTVGVESLNHFGEYEDDSVFVRNDRLKCDYEILIDQRRYSDVIETQPPRREDIL